jgi:hypothetical protein
MRNKVAKYLRVLSFGNRSTYKQLKRTWNKVPSFVPFSVFTKEYLDAVISTLEAAEGNEGTVEQHQATETT